MDSPGGDAGVLRVLGREAGKGAATKNFSKPGQLLGAGKVEGRYERGGSREEDLIYDLKWSCLIEKRWKGDLDLQQEGLRLDVERDFPLGRH